MVDKNKRILFIDLMRAFAVFMMVQGHTVHSLLADEYASLSYIPYLIWHTIRGITAPIFMFSSGTVFTYLLLTEDSQDRVKKGFKRFATLLLLGYLLRYPTYTIFYFGGITEESWKQFFIVDALHLIGFGLLFILVAYLLAKKLKLSYNWFFLALAVFFFGLFPFVKDLPFASYMPIPFANYLTMQYGAFFPFFPYAGFVMVGAVFGQHLALNKGIHLNKKFILKFNLLAVGIILTSYTFIISKGWLYDSGYFEVFNRTGFVLLLISFMMYFTLGLKKVHWIIKGMGRHTLAIYVVHLIILYGCAWFPGFYKYIGRSFTPLPTIIIAVLMEALMITMVYYLEKRRFAKQQQFITVRT